MRRIYLYIAWTIALVATAGSLFFSYGLGWLPCDLCWYQRVFMFPLVIVLGVGILKESMVVPLIAGSLASVGAAIALFHNLLIYKVIPESAAPCSSGISCTAPYHFFNPVITIPLLTLLAFLAIIALMVIYRKEKEQT